MNSIHQLKWTTDDLKTCITSQSLVEAAQQTGRSLPSIYTMRDNYKKFVSGVECYISKPLLDLFIQIKGTELSSIARHSRRMNREIFVDKMPDSSQVKDPEIQLEIACKNFIKEVVALSRQMAKEKMSLEFTGLIQKVQRKFEENS